jgi:ABC-type transport system substrate-binding protein
MAFSRRRLLGTSSAIGATGLVAAACGGGSSTGSSPSSSANPSNTAGVAASTPPPSTAVNATGVLNMINEEAFEHLDPQNIYVNNSQAIARLMFRALMGYHEDPSNGTFTLTPDLAAEMPTANADNTVWTFKIRTGVKYADGTAVTAADIKYGVERSMDPNIPYGPQYAKQYLVGAASYTGPSKGDLASIVVPDPQTIVFHLAQPVGTWAELCTLPTFIPVPKAKDTGKTYDLHPVCMGPYTIQTYTQATTLVLVPNTHWDKSTDPLRSQYFKEVNVKMNVNPNTVDEELFTDGQGGTLATFDAPQPANVAKAVTSEYSSPGLDQAEGTAGPAGPPGTGLRPRPECGAQGARRFTAQPGGAQPRADLPQGLRERAELLPGPRTGREPGEGEAAAEGGRGHRPHGDHGL